MIDKIVRNYKTHDYNSVAHIKEKLDYFRSHSAFGIHKLSEANFIALQNEFNHFFNLKLAFFADKYPTRLFRVTNNKYVSNCANQKLQKISQLIGPPAGHNNYGRCNLPGESLFYAALDFKTAIWETQPEVGDYITVSIWKIKEHQKLYTHTIFHPELTNLTLDSQTAYEAYIKSINNIYPELKINSPDIKEIFHEIFKFLTEEYMKVVNRDEKRNYLFSSCYSSRLLQSKQDKKGLQIEAISYPSVKMEYGLTNIAILNSLVLEKLDLLSIIIMSVAETNYDNENLHRGDLIKISGIQYEVKEFDFENDKIIYNPEEELRLGLEQFKMNEMNEKEEREK